MLEVRYNGWSDLCSNPDPDQLVFRLPTDQQPSGWTKGARLEAPEWLDLPDYSEYVDKLIESQVEHIRQELERWGPVFPDAPGVRALPTILDAHENKRPVQIP